jgi:hypothetical protein
MGILDKMSSKLQPLFKAEVPDLKKYYGRTILIDGKKVRIESIVGNHFKRQFYEINGEHLISMLRFHAQVMGDKSITEQQFLDFENMEMDSEKLPDPVKKPPEAM